MELAQDVNFDKLARYTPSYVGRDFKDLCFEAEKLAGKRVIHEIKNNSGITVGFLFFSYIIEFSR